MKIRAALHLGEKAQSLQLFSVLQETADHLVLKLAAAIFFHETEPEIISSPQQSPALAGQDFAPDLLKVDDTNQVTLWVECGKTTLHKLTKVTKRFREARLIMLTAHPVEAKQIAANLNEEDLTRFKVWSFDFGEFERWRNMVQEQNDIIGEADETSMNLVVNGQIFVTTLRRIGL
jgi:uncharacterized protein YaeQ